MDPFTFFIIAVIACCGIGWYLNYLSYWNGFIDGAVFLHEDQKVNGRPPDPTEIKQEINVAVLMLEKLHKDGIIYIHPNGKIDRYDCKKD